LSRGLRQVERNLEGLRSEIKGSKLVPGENATPEDRKRIKDLNESLENWYIELTNSLVTLRGIA
jgi:hypothetical protein